MIKHVEFILEKDEKVPQYLPLYVKPDHIKVIYDRKPQLEKELSAICKRLLAAAPRRTPRKLQALDTSEKVPGWVEK
jgi:hypothetical protein